MYKLLFCLLFLSFSVAAEYSEDPYAKIPTDNNMTNKSKITWRPVDDVVKECNKERVKYGQKPYTFQVQACASWGFNLFRQAECVIITSKTPNMATLGHEMRHCFQGSYHDY
jgi:hypothetical protein